MPLIRAVLAAALALCAAAPARAQGATPPPGVVALSNDSVHTRCAEEDNVSLTVRGQGIARFRAIARQPAYIDQVKVDRTAPDFTNCIMNPQNDFTFTPRTVTLYEDEAVLVRGVTYPRYWRPERVEVRVGERIEEGLHLVQLFTKRTGKPQEVLVLHAADGYWRLRPLPPARFAEAVYGTSFLVGPVEQDGRPLVRIRRVDVEPRAMALTVRFTLGGSARVAVSEIGEPRAVADIAFDQAAGPYRPFLAIRSMFVAADNADAAELAWRPPGGAWRAGPVLSADFPRASAFALRRSRVSRHNTSAPDMLFEFD